MQSTASISGLPVSRAISVESSRSWARIFCATTRRYWAFSTPGHPPPVRLRAGRRFDRGGDVVLAAVRHDAESIERGRVDDLPGRARLGPTPTCRRSGWERPRACDGPFCGMLLSEQGLRGAAPPSLVPAGRAASQQAGPGASPVVRFGVRHRTSPRLRSGMLLRLPRRPSASTPPSRLRRFPCASCSPGCRPAGRRTCRCPTRARRPR